MGGTRKFKENTIQNSMDRLLVRQVFPYLNGGGKEVIDSSCDELCKL